MRKKDQQEDDQQLSEQETVRRRDEWLRRSLNTPPKTHKEVVAERRQGEPMRVSKGAQGKPRKPNK